MLFEGLRLSAYPDKAGVWTIGYGSTYYENGQPVKKGDRLASKDAAISLFRHTMQHYIDAVNQLVTVPLNQNQFDALVSFTYNEGTGALGTSHLLAFVNKSLFNAAADEFLRWNKVRNPETHQLEPCDDLTLRRKRERLTFLKSVA